VEAMLGISLYSYLYPKLSKALCFSYYLLCFLLNKIGEQEGKTGSAPKWGRGRAVVREGVGGTWPKVYHVNKCKNNKMKGKKKLGLDLVPYSEW
jgi:hypothetical protein